jgi:hypothetical protein
MGSTTKTLHTTGLNEAVATEPQETTDGDRPVEFAQVSTVQLAN